MLGIKQEVLAADLGQDWTQKKVSLLEQKETIESEILDQVTKILKVSPEAIRNFSEEAANHFFNTFSDSGKICRWKEKIECEVAVKQVS